jgi:hypothetical protein
MCRPPVFRFSIVASRGLTVTAGHVWACGLKKASDLAWNCISALKPDGRRKWNGIIGSGKLDRHKLTPDF